MSKEYNKQPRSQAFGLVSLKEVINNKNFILNKGNVLVKVLPKNKRGKYTPDHEELGYDLRNPKRADINGKPDKRMYTEEVPCNDFMIDREKYLSYGKKDYFKKAFEYITKPGLESLEIKNSTLAKEIGCSKRTATRITDRFYRDGIIEKYSRGTYSVNIYIVSEELTKDGPLSTSLWLSRLSDKESEDFDMFGILPGGHLSKDFLKNKEEIEKSGFTLDNEPNGQLYNTTSFIEKLNKSTIQKNVDKYFVDGREGKNRHIKTKSKKYPVSRDEEMSRKTLNFNDIGFSSIMESIASLYELNASKKLKLFAFPISCLDHVFENMESYVSPKRGGDRFFSKCESYCAKHRMKPDWNRYISLCKEYGIPKDITSSSNSKSEMYKTHVPQKKDTLVYLLQERVRWEKTIKEAVCKGDPLGTIPWARSLLAKVDSELAERIDNGETIQIH